jgi:hypothetical protein
MNSMAGLFQAVQETEDRGPAIQAGALCGFLLPGGMALLHRPAWVARVRCSQGVHS